MRSSASHITLLFKVKIKKNAKKCGSVSLHSKKIGLLYKNGIKPHNNRMLDSKAGRTAIDRGECPRKSTWQKIFLKK